MAVRPAICAAAFACARSANSATNGAGCFTWGGAISYTASPRRTLKDTLSNMVSATNILLAIDGGKPTVGKSLPQWPEFAPDEIEAASAVLASGKVNYWTGEEGRNFEREYASYVGTQHAIAVANGTVALELALHALGIGVGDEVIVPSRTFIASASCVVMCGAVPVIADIDPISGDLTADVAPLVTRRTK